MCFFQEEAFENLGARFQALLSLDKFLKEILSHLCLGMPLHSNTGVGGKSNGFGTTQNGDK